MSDLGGITLSSGEHVYAGLSNSFAETPDGKKRKYLIIAIAVVLIAEIITYLTFSYQGEAREIPYSSASIDLGDFKPRARRAPVIEIDEVFGNQFVKEKKDASALPANEAGGSIDGEGVVDLDVEGTGSGGNAPNIARCAVRNFPAEAKQYVEEALVLMSILVDKSGMVREAKPLYVNFKKNLPPELKDRMKKLFMSAGRASLMGRRCPVWYANGVATGYKLEVPLSYELYN
ncbi:MAG: hypothetical protein JNJ69_03405 [Leptospiraceae bacterium]|nr:hypothetical protein [Leptospiraceae bacterium]